MEYAVWIIAGCLGVITVILVVWLSFVIYVLAQIRRTAIAVEALAYSVRAQVDRLKEATDTVRDFAGFARGGWAQAVSAGLGAAFSFWNRPRKPDCC